MRHALLGGFGFMRKQNPTARHLWAPWSRKHGYLRLRILYNAQTCSGMEQGAAGLASRATPFPYWSVADLITYFVSAIWHGLYPGFGLFLQKAYSHGNGEISKQRSIHWWFRSLTMAGHRLLSGALYPLSTGSSVRGGR